MISANKTGYGENMNDMVRNDSNHPKFKALLSSSIPHQCTNALWFIKGALSQAKLTYEDTYNVLTFSMLAFSPRRLPQQTAEQLKKHMKTANARHLFEHPNHQKQKISESKVPKYSKNTQTLQVNTHPT